jgi:hypothetical protein
MYTAILVTDDPVLLSQVYELCRLIPANLTPVTTIEELDPDNYADVVFWGYENLSYEQFQAIEQIGALIMHFMPGAGREFQRLGFRAPSDPRIPHNHSSFYSNRYGDLADLAEEFAVILSHYTR